MKILIDTNILISAILFPHSKPTQALLHVSAYHDMALCEQNIYELFTVIKRKVPYKLPAAKEFLTELSFASEVDIILTGDKYFLSLDISRPECITAVHFLERI